MAITSATDTRAASASTRNSNSNTTAASNSNNTSSNGTSTTSSASAQALASTNPAVRGMGQAMARIQSQLDTTTAQLSSFGKLKSSVSDVQLAAKALGGLGTTASAADAKAALARFLAGLNTALTTAKTTAALPGSSPTEVNSANRASRDLSRSVTANTATLDALKKLGIKPQPDGSFTLDGAKFDAAFQADPASARATLAKLGRTVEAVATQELATNASVSGALTNLSQRATALKAQQTSMLAVVQKLNAASTASGNTGYVNYGVSAYRASS